MPIQQSSSDDLTVAEHSKRTLNEQQIKHKTHNIMNIVESIYKQFVRINYILGDVMRFFCMTTGMYSLIQCLAISVNVARLYFVYFLPRAQHTTRETRITTIYDSKNQHDFDVP